MSSRILHIVLPLAGRGSRFANAGFTTPKPLIAVDGLPMFMKALSSLDKIKAPKRHTFILRQEHEDKFDLSQQIRRSLPEANFVYVDEEPSGALVDTMRAESLLEPDEGVILLDCDLWFRSKGYEEIVTSALGGDDADGALLTFTANDPRYSYAAVGSDQLVAKTAEKQVISDRAITGAYFVSSAEKFITVAKKLLAAPLPVGQVEYYISPLFNALIVQGAKIKAASVDEFASFGTPEELAAYENR